ncbi:uncharacterized protein AAGF69_002557 isoform 1-T1 [Amazona ochrocephala]
MTATVPGQAPFAEHLIRTPPAEGRTQPCHANKTGNFRRCCISMIPTCWISRNCSCDKLYSFSKMLHVAQKSLNHKLSVAGCGTVTISDGILRHVCLYRMQQQEPEVMIKAKTCDFMFS